MTTKETLRLKAKSLLALGEAPKDVAEKTGLGYQTILKLRKDLEAETDADVTTIDPVAVQVIVDKAREDNVPSNIVKKLEVVQEGITGLQKLDNEFHTTMSKVLQKANEFLDGDSLKPSEWVAITNSLSSAYNNIFNNSGVNVHVDNSTNVSSTAVSMMKGALRG